MHLSRGGYKSPEYWILMTIMRHLEKEESVMLLATCSYMLQPVIAVLRKSGIPFHNPFRKSNGFWNPLRRGSNGCTNRLFSFLGAQPWTHADLKLWAACLPNHGILRTGARELIDASDDSLLVTPDRIRELFESASADSLLGTGGDSLKLLDWFVGGLLPSSLRRLKATTFPPVAHSQWRAQASISRAA